MTNSVSFASLPSSALNWPRCVARFRLLLDDQPGHLGAVAEHELADRADQRRARRRSGARRWSPWRRRRRAPASAHASGRRPAGSAVRSAFPARRRRRCRRNSRRRRRPCSARRSRRRCHSGSSAGAKLPSVSFSARRWTVTPSIAGAFAAETPFSTRQHGGAFDQRRDAPWRCGRASMRRHRRQQPAQIGVVPGFDAPRRQAGLDRLDRVVALQHHRAVAGQQRQPLAERVDQRRLGRGALAWQCMFMHVHLPAPHAASPMTPA